MIDTDRRTARDRTARRALVLVDLQPTFCEGGELGVEGGNRVAADVADHLRRHRGDYDVVVTTQDWHIDPGAHFSDTPDFVDTWPPHGIAGTPNAEIHPTVVDALSATGGADVSILKGQYAAAYSGFDGADTSGTGLSDALRSAGVTTIDVCGLAESHCVQATVLDAIEAGFAVRVLADLTVPVTEESGRAARAAMAAAGATSVLSGVAFGEATTDETIREG